MSDPFAMLDPLGGKPKSSTPSYPSYNYPGAPAAPLGVTGSMNNMFNQPTKPQQPTGMGIQNIGGLGIPNMGGMGMPNMGGMGMTNMGGMGMGGGMPSMGGMGVMGMGMTQPPQQAPMYDNIKNLLNQKPKDAFGDSASMDFLENLGSPKSFSSVPIASAPQIRAPEPTNFGLNAAALDPFGASSTSAAPASAAMDFSGFESGSSNDSTAPVSASSGKSSSVLADRQRQRKTQEAQRSTLGFNAGAFATTATSSPRISLKEMVGVGHGSKNSSSFSDDEREKSLSIDDFINGGQTAATTPAKSDNLLW
jgi:hypothetical protein